MDQAKVKRATYRTLFTKTANALSNFLEQADEKTKIEAEFAKLTDRYNVLKEIQNEVLSLYFDDPQRDPQDLEADLESAETYVTRWYLLQKRVKEYNEEYQSTKMSAGKTVKSSSSSRSHHLRLPRLDLPKFDGTISKWLGFWAQFKRIHADDALDDDEKLQYLLQCMEPGSSARELVESFPPTGKNYDIVLNQLKERFAREDIIIEHYVRELLQLVLAQTKGLMKPSTRYLYDKLMTQILALESLGVTKDKYAAFLFPLVESALPEDLLRAWNRSHLHTNSAESSPLTDLLNFLKKEVESEERIRLSRSGYTEEGATSSPTAAFYAGTQKKDDKQGKSIQPVMNVKDCLWCEKTSHASSECRQAMNMTLEERRKFIKTKNACSICLNKGHIWRKCKKFPKCLVCGKKHFTIMCEGLDKERNQERNEQSSNSSNDQVTLNQIASPTSKSVLLQTLKIKIVNGNEELQVRALLDSGAQRSFIKSDIVAKLNLKPIGTQELSHVLFGGAVTKKRNHNIFKLNVQSLDGAFTREVEALEQGTICGHLPRIRQGGINSRLQDLGIHLTDCIDNVSEISLLIGSDILGSLFTGRSVQIDENLLAVETKLGWTVQGPALGVYCSVGNVNHISLNNACSFEVDDLWKLETLGIREESEVKSQQKLDSEVAIYFKNTITVNEEGRYEVNLPWKDTAELLQPNYHLAFKRLLSTTSKLTKLGILDDYNLVFEEWRASGIIEEVPNDDPTSGHYVAHHPVVRESSATTKIRPVINGTNLRATSNLLKDVDWKEVLNQTTSHKISWRFIPPSAPWWGGIWERLIKSIKEILRRVLGKAALQMKELETVLYQVEAVLNARPLTCIDAGTENLIPLTPAMFMNIHSASTSVDTAEVFGKVDGRILSSRWRFLTKLEEDLKRRFRSEYLSLLAQKSSRNKIRAMKVGDVVIIGSDNKKRVSWPLGLVLEIFPGRDGQNRVARVRTQSGILTRPLQRLFSLEIPTEPLSAVSSA